MTAVVSGRWYKPCAAASLISIALTIFSKPSSTSLRHPRRNVFQIHAACEHKCVQTDNVRFVSRLAHQGLHHVDETM